MTWYRLEFHVILIKAIVQLVSYFLLGLNISPVTINIICGYIRPEQKVDYFQLVSQQKICVTALWSKYALKFLQNQQIVETLSSYRQS